MKQGRLTPMEGKGHWGRTLLADVPAQQLLAGDRLEPFDGLRCPADFERKRPPLQRLFWRASLSADRKLEDSIVHRRPLFDDEVGASVENLAVD
eukprot:953610-Pyramimonas_sp.AAC.1